MQTVAICARLEFSVSYLSNNNKRSFNLESVRYILQNTKSDFTTSLVYVKEIIECVDYKKWRNHANHFLWLELRTLIINSDIGKCTCSIITE